MSRRNEFEVAGRKATAKMIKAFRSAMRAQDCKRAQVYLDMLDAPYIARRATVWRLKDQFTLACKRG